MFIISSFIHLYASNKRDRFLRNISKGFIIPSLMILYYTKTPSIDNTFMLALLFSWIGDLLLIGHGKKFFTAGGISFMISHILFVVSYSKHIHNLNNYIFIIILIAIIYIIITSIIFKHLAKYLPKALIIPMFVYLLINASMNCGALSLLVTNKSLASLIVFIGAISFFISDSNLFFVRFKVELKQQNHFIVMLTYILAELLIVIGMINI